MFFPKRFLIFPGFTKVNCAMSIANELCSEVATAVLTRHDDPSQLDAQELTRKILLEVHDTLRRLNRENRRRDLLSSAPSSPQKNAASINH